MLISWQRVKNFEFEVSGPSMTGWFRPKNNRRKDGLVFEKNIKTNENRISFKQARYMNSYETENHPSIVTAGPLTIQEGVITYRYVLVREELGNQVKFSTYREHLQLIDCKWKHFSFYYGHQFSKLSLAQTNLRERISA